MKTRVLLIAFVLVLIPFGRRANAQMVTLLPTQCGLVGSLWPTTNFPSFPDFIAISWTNGGNPCTDRSFMQFDFTSIPNGAIIDSAFLSLRWHISVGNTGHSTTSGSNLSYLQRVTSSWAMNSITWNTQPSSVTTNQVTLPMTTSDTQSYMHINLLALVQDMIANVNYGIAFRMQTESYYRSMLFASSYVTDSTLMPRLRVYYHIPYTITPQLTFNSLCAGGAVSVPYNVVGPFIAGNTFIAQLSDSSGGFVFPQNIGTIASTTSGTINASIPQYTIPGNHYRIRVVASNPVFIGAVNGQNITVNATPTPIITASGSTTICQGDSVMLTASANASYLWNTFGTTQSIMAYYSGYYFVMVTGNNGCSASSAMTQVNFIPVVNPVITANHSLTLCFGDTVTLTSSAAVAYQWNNGSTLQRIRVYNAGNYMLTVTDNNGCTAVSLADAVTIDIPAVPVITYNGNLLASSSATGNQWLLNNAPIAGATNFIYVAPTTGCYSLMVTDSNGCFSVSDTVCIVISHNGIHELGADANVAVFPNPNHGAFTLLYHAPMNSFIDIKDGMGRIVYSYELGDVDGRKLISLALNSGFYFWELKNGGEVLEAGKMVICE